MALLRVRLGEHAGHMAHLAVGADFQLAVEMEAEVRLAACDHTARQGGFDGSVSAKSTGPIPQIAMTAGSFWLRITPS